MSAGFPAEMYGKVPIFGSVLQQFLNHIKSHNLVKESSRVLLAVSGGIDSMVMLRLFKDAGYAIGIAHCNFQLRGEESDGDENFVNEAATRLSIPFYSKRFETASYAERQGVSIQMAARELRYAWFNELLAEEGYDYLATAHHLNDSIETVLLSFVKGTGLEGFDGIAVKNQRTIRPLLFATRTELEEFARTNQIAWREDSSNQTTDYQRNFIRNSVVPLLKEINPSLEETVKLGHRKITGELNFLSAAMESWKQKNVFQKGDVTYISKAGIENAAVLWHALRMYGFSFLQCEEIVEILTAQSGKRFLSATHQAVLDREEIQVHPKELEWGDATIFEGDEKVSLGSYQLTISKSEVKASTQSSVAVLDAGKLQFPLTWRRWRPGDYFYPLGMQHKKKLSDFFIDEKVSQAEKHYATVLESAGEIVWVVGYRIDNRFKLTEQTRLALSFTLGPYFD